MKHLNRIVRDCRNRVRTLVRAWKQLGWLTRAGICGAAIGVAVSLVLLVAKFGPVVLFLAAWLPFRLWASLGREFTDDVAQRVTRTPVVVTPRPLPRSPVPTYSRSLTDMLADGKRRATRYGVQADKVTADEVRASWDELALYTCYLCDLPFSEYSPMTLEHVVPLSKGGTHALTNFAPAHRRCNSQKGNRPAELYIFRNMRARGIDTSRFEGEI